MTHIVLQTLGVVFVLGMLSQWIAWKFRIPVIILLTSLGILSGPVFNIINPPAVFGPILPSIIELAVAIILFEGGMNLRFHEFAQVSSGIRRLFSLAVIINWIGGALASHYIAGISWEVSLLIAGILVVTGPTVIIPALREAKLKRSTANYLKWEGIINDPIGAMLAVLVFDYMVNRGEMPGTALVFISLGKIILIAFGLSYLTKVLVSWGTHKAMLPEFLKIPFFITIILVLFIASELLQKGSGLLCVTLLGLFLGNANIPVIKELRRFEESIAVFTVSSIFIILSASLDISVWQELALGDYILILVFSFVIRPLAIYLSTIRSSMSVKERILIGFYGPRGIVAVSVAGVLGTNLYGYGIEEGRLVLPVIFSVVLITVVFHSLWLKKLARHLGLINPEENGVIIVGASPWSIQLSLKLQQHNIPVLLTDTSWYKLVEARTNGIKVHFGNIIKDLEYGQPDITSYNYLMAVTDDDHYNSLICHKLEHRLGSDHVYQLPVHEDEFGAGASGIKMSYCELSDSQEALYENMMRNYHHGWVFKVTKLTDQYEYDQFKKDNPPNKAIYFMVIRANKRIEIFGSTQKYKPGVNDSIIYYGEAKSEKKAEEGGLRPSFGKTK